MTERTVLTFRVGWNDQQQIFDTIGGSHILNLSSLKRLTLQVLYLIVMPTLVLSPHSFLCFSPRKTRYFHGVLFIASGSRSLVAVTIQFQAVQWHGGGIESLYKRQWQPSAHATFSYWALVRCRRWCALLVFLFMFWIFIFETFLALRIAFLPMGTIYKLSAKRMVFQTGLTC